MPTKSNIMDLHELMDFISKQRAKGISDYQIVQSLISNGYSSSQIYDALTQLDLKNSTKIPPSGTAVDIQQPSAVSNQTKIESQMQSTQNNNSQTPIQSNNIQTSLPQGNEALIEQTQQSAAEMQYLETNTQSNLNPELIEKVQEISETIIEEKWDELVSNVKKIVEWKNRMEDKINKLSERMDVLEKDMESLKTSIFSKIKDYDSHITEFSTDLKALQKVFGDMLPEFVSGIHQLKDILNQAKKE